MDEHRSWYNGSVWHTDWPHEVYVGQWLIFYGPVILLLIWKTILAQTANATVSVFGNIVVAHAFAKLFSKQIIQLLKRHTKYVFQLSVSRASRTTPLYWGRVSYKTQCMYFFQYSACNVFVYLEKYLKYCDCFGRFETLNAIVCQCIICCLFGFDFAVH